MSRVKLILFNTDMIRAILDGRKTVTRRCVKFLTGENPNWTGYIKDGLMLYNGRNEPCCSKPPYQPGDILYVRETWCPHNTPNGSWYGYKADGDYRDVDLKWRPSIHMPKEAARIWLKVTDVRVERLQDMSTNDSMKEGIHYCECPDGYTWKFETDMHNCYTRASGAMKALWNSTIKKSDLDRYGWEANPWVWVIEFERCEKPTEV